MKRWWIPAAVAAAGVLAIGGLYLYNYVSGRQVANEIYVPKKITVTPDVVLLQQYIRINTSNPPGNETAGARFLAAQLERGGVHAEIIESAPGRGSVYARIRGRRRGEGLMLLSHIDVVPATPAGWRRPPFAADIQLDMLYGRGALDMKGIAICELEALLAVARLGRAPERDLVFLATADEEEYGGMGMVWLLAHRPDIFDGVRYVINEGGINESFQDKLTYFGVEIGTKMIVKTELHAASRADLERLRLAMEPYFSPRDPDRVLPEVKEFLRDLAPRRVESQGLLEDVDRTIASGKFWLLQRAYKEAMENIVWAEEVKDDPAGGATMNVGMYNLPDEDPDKRLTWLAGFIRPFGATIAKVPVKSGPAPLSPRHTPFFALITDEVHRQWGNDTAVGTQILNIGINDSRFLRSRGIICYGLWPFQVDFYQTQAIHNPNERVRVEFFQKGVVMLRELVTRYCTEL